MSDEQNEQVEDIVEGGEEEIALSTEEIIQEHLAELNEAYSEVGYFTRLKRMFSGLKAPKSSPEYKLARTEVQRLIAPVLAIFCPIAGIIVLCVMTEITGKFKENLQVEIARTQDNEEALEEEGEQQDIETPEDNTEIDISVDTPTDVPSQVNDVAVSLTAESTDQSIKPPDANSVALIKSPVAMKSVFGETRSAASRASALKKYGGDDRTEAAVINALRWLKMTQRPDGGWSGNTGADHQSVTGLAILTFLAHGEKSGGGEFGNTVAKGLEYLMKNSSNLDPVGTHALAEAYGFLKNPNLKDSATKAVQVMCDKLADTTWGPDDDLGKNTRPMLLKMAFQTMALKSAQMSGIAPDNLQVALDRLKEGLLIQGNKKDGGFSSDYYGPPRGQYRRTGIWHFMVGVVAMQYLGYGDHPIIERTMKILDDDWELPTLGSIDSSCCPVRGNYWATMVFFNGGGKRWQRWNRAMIDAYFKGQTIMKNAYTDLRGNKLEMGYWTCEDMHIGSQPTATTCWVALQLMVYYRYLPTSSKAARGIHAAAADKPKEEPKHTSAAEVEVDI